MADSSTAPEMEPPSAKKPLSLALSLGGIRSKHLTPWDTTLEGIARDFQRLPRIADRDGSYYCRGPVDPDNPTRANANIRSADVIIIDADKSMDFDTGETWNGAPDPMQVHIALREENLLHVLYSTHSHQRDGKGNRYRVIVGGNTGNEYELEAALAYLFHCFHKRGIPLFNVKENATWSQGFYFPRVADAGAAYLCYAYTDGEPLDTAAAVAWFEHHREEPVACSLQGVTAATTSSEVADSPIARFNASHGNPDWILQTLQSHGYTVDKESTLNGHPSYRLLAPTSTSGSPGVVIFATEEGRWLLKSHHGDDDPLSRAGDEIKICDAWDVNRILNYRDDQRAALQAWSPVKKADSLESASPKPVIEIVPGMLHVLVKEAAAALAAVDPPRVFQRESALVSVARLGASDTQHGCTLPAGTTTIYPLQKAALQAGLCGAATWRVRRYERWVDADPTDRLASALLQSPGSWEGIPRLIGIADVPVLHDDGRLVCTPGYDAETGLFVEGNFPELSVPDQPTREDALNAAKRLLNPFREFPFVDRRLDEAVLLAYLLTMAQRWRMRTAPLACMSGTSPGAGKGLLVDASNMLVRGQSAATLPALSSKQQEEEMRKRVSTLLLLGVNSVNLDNCIASLGGESLNVLLTTDVWTDRKLGGNEGIRLPTRITLAATGNNLSVRGDCVRRALLIRLDPKTERPEKRPFEERDLLGHIRRHRGELLSALFTILRAFQVAGRPGDQEQRLGSFEEWSERVAAPIRWLGYPDPTASQDLLREEDPETERLGSLLSAWWEHFDDKWVRARDLRDLVNDLDLPNCADRAGKQELSDALQEVAGEGRHINGRKLGWYLRHFKGRVAGGLRLEPKPSTTGKNKDGNLYRVVRVDE